MKFTYMVKQLTEEMVERVPWMSPIDYEILLFFEEHDILVSPKVLGANIEYDRQYTGKRCRALQKADLLKRHDNGLYGLATRGRRFLKGEIDPSELEEPN